MGYFCTETMIFWDSRTFWVILVVCQITEIRACRMMGSPASSWCLQRRSGMPATIQPMYIGYPPEINQSNEKSPMNGHSNGNIIFKRVIFHCNVWFPEGKLGQVGDDFFVAKWSKDAQACQACPGCFFFTSQKCGSKLSSIEMHQAWPTTYSMRRKNKNFGQGMSGTPKL